MRLARRQRIEGCRTSGPTRDNRLHTKTRGRDVERIAALVDGGQTPPEHAGPKCACRLANATTRARQPMLACCAFAPSRVAALMPRLALDPSMALPYGAARWT